MIPANKLANVRRRAEAGMIETLDLERKP